MQEPNQRTKLLALDIENTIVHYDHLAKQGADGRFPAMIDGSLVDIFSRLVAMGFVIVTATGTDGDNIAYYQREFQKAEIGRFFSAMTPQNGTPADSKEDKLDKYCIQFGISDKNNVYFYDDGESNVTRAKAAGYANASQVTAEDPLVLQLVTLLSQLEHSAVSSAKTSAVTPATTIAKRGSPIMQRDSFARWHVGVDTLHAEVLRLTSLYGIDETAKTANAYVASILDAIRKNAYDKLAQDPEAHNINSVIFSEIDQFIQSNRFIIERKGVSDDEIKSLATQINARNALTENNALADDFVWVPSLSGSHK